MGSLAYIGHERGPFAVWRRPVGQRFINRWGDCSRIAGACGVTTQAVSQWKRVPERHVRAVAALLGTTPERLRPDLAEKHLMTSTDMAPSDAAAALARRDESITQSVIELEDLHLATEKALANLHLARSHQAEANLAYERARASLRRARSSEARARRRMRDAGLPVPDFGSDPDGAEPFPSLAASAVGIGGVKAVGVSSVDRPPPQRVSPRNS
ncbi:helix-turn-helix domain-containing protein [Acetobacter orientalis]|uniref:helix-turn-helix domain-containing protein n=1 Tax=Acetobacter orientalis TaxID=146474 RepID=UPI00209EF7B5|nr:helix-turn-helix domain-containing protein [Acetobacter orientalis]MCP1215597.1 helix-turn-helix domain-containing protein [Acetobacter orientalis]MCP1217550.1 helix-turn-helix domain-containing protein [Acetobacter orientalis]